LRAIIDETAQRHHRTLTIKPESDLHQTKIAVGAGPGRGNNLPLLAQHLYARLTQPGPVTLQREVRQLILSHPAGCGASLDISDLSIWRSVAAMMPPAAIARIASATRASMSVPYSFATNDPSADLQNGPSPAQLRPFVHFDLLAAFGESDHRSARFDAVGNGQSIVEPPFVEATVRSANSASGFALPVERWSRSFTMLLAPVP
jgi:hypothetical protein